MSHIVDSINRMRSPKKLLQAFEAIKNRLSDLDISSSQTDPVGQYAEYLVAKLYDGKKTINGTAGCDIIASNGCRIEVKGRVARKEGYNPKTYIKDSNVSGDKFDYLVYVVFNTNYDINRAYGMSIDTFKYLSNYVEHNNSSPKWSFKASPDILQQKGVDDLTEALSACQ